MEVFESYLNKEDAKRNDAIRYGLAVAYQDNRQFSAAEKILTELLDTNPGRITLQVTLADVLSDQGRHEDARALLKPALARNPGNYPITWALAGVEIADGNGAAGAALLKDLARQRPSGDQIWLRLAEAEGMARNIVGVHRARAEYEVLMGDYRSAQRQLRQAQEKLPAGSAERQVVNERLGDIASRIQDTNNP